MATKRKKKKSPSKRISAALTRYLRKMNPGKMKGVSQVRVKKLKNGGLTITPVQGNGTAEARKEGRNAAYSDNRTLNNWQRDDPTLSTEPDLAKNPYPRRSVSAKAWTAGYEEAR